MRKIISFLVIILLFTSCEEQQKKEAKTKEEIENYSISCVKHFLEELHDDDDDARERCVVYSVSKNDSITGYDFDSQGKVVVYSVGNNDSTTLYDAAKSMNVNWNPDEVKIDTIVDFILEEDELKYVVVKATYKGKHVKFAVTFDHSYNSGYAAPSYKIDSVYSGSEGKAIIVDSKGFLPTKSNKYERKAKVPIMFTEKWDLMSILLSKKSLDYINKANSFLNSAKLGVPNYTNYRPGKVFGKYVLTDSINQTCLSRIDFKFKLKDIVDKKIFLSSTSCEVSCEVKYTKNISFFFEYETIVDTRGIFNFSEYCRNKYGNFEFCPQYLLWKIGDKYYIWGDYKTTDMTILKDIKEAIERKKDREEFLRLTKELNRKMEENGVDYFDCYGNPHYKSE